VASSSGEQPVAGQPTSNSAEEPPLATAPVEWANSLAGRDRAVRTTAEDDPQPGTVTSGGPVGTASPDTAATGEPAAVVPGRAAGKKREHKGPLGFLRELPVLLVVAFVLALLIKTFLVQAFYIPSESMVPTLQVGDRVLVNKVVYHLHPPRRGDIIVFSDPHPTEVIHRGTVAAFVHWLTDGLGVQKDPTKDFIKRVIGLPGDTVEFAHGQVMINGRVLNEPYAHAADNSQFGPVRVPADSLFVMGDNRPNSNDSRGSLGFIPSDKVIGRAFIVIWPPSRFGWLHGL
jgi:signal peptidase I